MNLETAKTLGVIGTILQILGVFTGGYVSLIGFLLVLLAVYGVSDETDRPGIFRNYILAFIMEIIGAIIVIVVVIGTLARHTVGGPPGAGLETDIVSIYTRLILWFVILWIFFVIGTYFLRKSYKGIAEALDHDIFSVVGTLYFIGGLLTIVGIGLLLILFAVIIEIVAWATMPTIRPSRRRQPAFQYGSEPEEPVI